MIVCSKASYRRILSVVACFLCVAIGTNVWATQRQLRSALVNYEGSPIIIKRSRAKFIETQTSSALTSSGESNSRFSRIQSVSDADQSETGFLLKGELLCKNESRKTVRSVSLMVIPMDKNHAALRVFRREGQSKLIPISLSLPGGTERNFRWKEEVQSDKVTQVAVIIRQVQFTDGTKWKSTKTEVVDIF